MFEDNHTSASNVLIGLIVIICTVLLIGWMLYSDTKREREEQAYLAATGETVTVTQRTNLRPLGYAVDGGDSFRVEYITDEDTVNTGSVIAFYDETGTAQIGMVMDVIDDTTFSVFLNNYNDTDKALPVPAEDIYGLVNGYIPVVRYSSSGGSSGFVNGYMIGKMFK